MGKFDLISLKQYIEAEPKSVDCDLLEKNGNWKSSDRLLEWNEFNIDVKIILLQIRRRQVEDMNIDEWTGENVQNTRILRTTKILRCQTSHAEQRHCNVSTTIYIALVSLPGLHPGS